MQNCLERTDGKSLKIILYKYITYVSGRPVRSLHNFRVLLGLCDDISSRFSSDNGGAIQPNLLQIPNTESNSQYLRYCTAVGVKSHPARFPEKLPAFFIQFLTEPGDTVLDIFAGSNTTGVSAEHMGRHWIAFEKDRNYLLASIFRFIEEIPPNELMGFWHHIQSSQYPFEIVRRQQKMVFMETISQYEAGAK